MLEGRSLLSAGSLDPTFGNGGIVTTDLGSTDDVAHDVAIQTDGKIVVVGRESSVFALARYNADGSLDTTFGTGGVVKADASFGTCRYDGGCAVGLQSDGKIVVAGNSIYFNGDFLVARFNPDGRLDSTFGIGGRMTADFQAGADDVYDLAIQSDDKIVVVGRAGAGSSIGTCAYNFAIARFTRNGGLDTDLASGFGDLDPNSPGARTGKVTTDFSCRNDIARSVSLQSDGKIVVAGFSIFTEGFIQDADFALARYTKVGTLDPTFGTNGRVTTDFGFGRHSDDYAYALLPSSP